MQNVYVELTKADDEEDNAPKTKQVNHACQFVYRNLEKRRYLIKVYEKQGKLSANPKFVMEQIIDLSDEREISGGVKILKLDIETLRKVSVDNLNYTIYSPIFLFTMVLSLLKLDYTIWIFNNVILVPFRIINKLFSKRR